MYPAEHLQLSEEWWWRMIVTYRYMTSVSTLVMLFEEKDRLLAFEFIYNYDQMNTKDLQGYMMNNYDIILTTLSSSGLAVFDSDYVNRK